MASRCHFCKATKAVYALSPAFLAAFEFFNGRESALNNLNAKRSNVARQQTWPVQCQHGDEICPSLPPENITEF